MEALDELGWDWGIGRGIEERPRAIPPTPPSIQQSGLACLSQQLKHEGDVVASDDR